MRLPEDFPHTRREQYLVTLPPDLQTIEELKTSIAVLDRLRRFNRGLMLRHIAQLQAAGWSDEDVMRLLTAGPPLVRH
jgi:hypothetical protein